MACAYAKYTGRLGVCLATSGPGGIHLLNGLYDAKLDGQPVLAITGHHYHDLIGTHAQQDVDLDKLFMDVAVYNTRIMGLAHVESVTHLACRTALSYRGVTHINFPTDIQDFTSAERSKRDVPGHTTAVRARGAGEPDERDLKYAADILNRGKKVAILAGRGALGAGQELEEAAEILGAPIVKALLGKVVPGFFLKPVSDAAVPDNSPYTTGGIGLLGTRASQEALEQCDTLLLAGTSFPYIEFMPKPGQAKAVQIDVDPTRFVQVLSNVLQTLNGSINAIWVGRLLGESALAATANANVVMFLLFAAVFGFGMATTVRVGQYFGARDIDAARRTFGAGIGFCFRRGHLGIWIPAGWKANAHS